MADAPRPGRKLIPAACAVPAAVPRPPAGGRRRSAALIAMREKTPWRQRMPAAFWRITGFSSITSVSWTLLLLQRVARRARLSLRRRLADATRKENRERAMDELRELLDVHFEERNVGAIVGALARVAPNLTDGLAKPALKRVAASVEVRSFGHGEVIFREGDAPTGYFFIVAGNVSIYKKGFT